MGALYRRREEKEQQKNQNLKTNYAERNGKGRGRGKRDNIFMNFCNESGKERWRFGIFIRLKKSTLFDFSCFMGVP